MAKPGLLLVSIDPSSRWDDVCKSSLLALNAIPSAVSKLVLQANDDPDPEKPYRYQIMFPLQNVSAISIAETVQKLNGLSADITLSLYERLNFHALDPGTCPESTNLIVQVGLTPKHDPEVYEDYHKWYATEHIQRLMAVPGWKTGSRYLLLEQGGSRKEYAAPLLSVHRYDKENGLGGAEWAKSIHTEWTKRVDSNKVRPPHRRMFEVQKVELPG